MNKPATPFAGRLLSEVLTYKTLPDACEAIGVSPQDIDTIASGHAPAESALIAIYEWLDARVVLQPNEREDYLRLKAEAAQRTVAVPAPGAPANVQPSPQPGRPSRKALAIGGGAALAVIILIVVVTVLLTVAVIRPAGQETASRPGPTPTPTAISASASPSATTEATASPSDSGSTASDVPASPTASPAAEGPAGNLIAHYSNYKLPCGDGITIGPGGPPAPQPYLGGDLATDCDGTWYAGDQENVGLLSGKASYAACSQDTVIGGQVSSITSGDVLCFQGAGTVALITIAGTGSTGGINYNSLNVRVWRTPNSSSSS